MVEAAGALCVKRRATRIHRARPERSHGAGVIPAVRIRSRPMERFALRFARSAALALALLSLPAQGALAQTEPPKPDDAILLTIFFRHDQSKTLDEINDQLKRQDFYKKFPPQGIEIVSWYIMMGIGQVVTLRVPAGRLREVNRAVEQSAWGAYRTEFYATYDYKPIALEQRRGN